MNNIEEAMKSLKINRENEILIEMANLSTKRTGLSVDIWSDGDGISRKVKHNDPRVKIGKRGQYEVSISIEKEPKILAKTNNIKQPEMNKIEKAIDYVGRNYDLFLKHFNSPSSEYDDDDLKDDLRKRGEYK